MAASTVIGAMTVNVNANTKNFSKGMAKTRGEFKKTSASANLFKTAIAAIGAYASIQGIRRLAGVIGETAQELDKLAKTSAKIGIASKEFAGLAHASRIAGVEVNTLDKGLLRMTQGIAEAAEGTGEAADAFRRLGINAQELSMMSVEKQFGTIADAVNKVGNNTQALNAIMDIFGTRAASLRNVLKEGSTGLRHLSDEAKILGIAIGEEQLKKVEDMNDAITRLQEAWGGAKNELTINIAPAAAEMLQGFLIMYTDYKREKTNKPSRPNAILEPVRSIWKLYKTASDFTDRQVARIVNPSRGKTKLPATDFGVSREDDRFMRRGVDVRKPMSLGASAKVNAVFPADMIGLLSGSKGDPKPAASGLSGLVNRLTEGVQHAITGSTYRSMAGSLTGSLNRQTIGGFSAMSINERQKREYSALKARIQSQQPLGQNSDILERGTAAGRAALRANLNKTDDKQLKLAEKAQEHRVELIEAVKQMFVPSVASI